MPNENPIDRFVAAILAAVRILVDKKTDGPDDKPLSFPDSDDTERLVRSIFPYNGRPKMLTRARKNAAVDESVFFTFVNWHISQGNLGSIMNARFKISMGEIDAETFDRVESLATVAVLVLRGRSTAVDNWNRAIYG